MCLLNTANNWNRFVAAKADIIKSNYADNISASRIQYFAIFVRYQNRHPGSKHLIHQFTFGRIGLIKDGENRNYINKLTKHCETDFVPLSPTSTLSLTLFSRATSLNLGRQPAANSFGVGDISIFYAKPLNVASVRVSSLVKGRPV